MTHLVYDLVVFARYMLVPGGRLVFFLPTVTEDWDDLDVPMVEGMKEIKWSTGSSQDFGKWSRKVSPPFFFTFVCCLLRRRMGGGHILMAIFHHQLITIERLDDQIDYPRPTFLPPENPSDKVPGHHKFGDRYAEKFATSGASTPLLLNENQGASGVDAIKDKIEGMAV